MSGDDADDELRDVNLQSGMASPSAGVASHNPELKRETAVEIGSPAMATDGLIKAPIANEQFEANGRSLDSETPLSTTSGSWDDVVLDDAGTTMQDEQSLSKARQTTDISQDVNVDLERGLGQHPQQNPLQHSPQNPPHLPQHHAASTSNLPQETNDSEQRHGRQYSLDLAGKTAQDHAAMAAENEQKRKMSERIFKILVGLVIFFVLIMISALLMAWEFGYFAKGDSFSAPVFY